MEINYRLILSPERDNPQQRDEANKFAQKYADRKGKFGYRFSFESITELNSALLILGEINHEVIIKIRPDSDKTLGEFPAYLIGLPTPDDLIKNGKVNGEILEKHKIAKSLQSFLVYATEEFKSLLDGITSGMEWKLLEDNAGGTCYSLTRAKQLEDPIIIKKAREISKNEFPKNTYTVLSDGRLFVTKRNQEILNNNGLVEYNMVRVVGGNEYSIPNRFLVSSSVMEKFIQNQETELSNLLFPVLDERSFENI